MGYSNRRPHRVQLLSGKNRKLRKLQTERHNAQIVSHWLVEHDSEFTELIWPPQSADLKPIEGLWNVVEYEIHIMDVQQVYDAIMST